MFDKWAQEDDSLSGVLNAKLTKIKNADFRLKMDAWKNRKTERKNQKKRRFDQGKKLREQLEYQRGLFTTNQEIMKGCISAYNDFDEKMVAHAREEKTINDFLSELPEGSHQTLEEADLERLLKNNEIKFKAKMQLLNDFVTAVKQEYVVEKEYFIFPDIPELIVKKKYSRKDYEDIIKLVVKVKNRYLYEKK